MKTIKLSDYTDAPGGRFISDGPYSGEWFVRDVIKPAYKDEPIELNFDGLYGITISFINQMVFELAKLIGVPKVKENIKIVCNDDPEIISCFYEYLAEFNVIFGTQWSDQEIDQLDKYIEQNNVKPYEINTIPIISEI